MIVYSIVRQLNNAGAVSAAVCRDWASVTEYLRKLREKMVRDGYTLDYDGITEGKDGCFIQFHKDIKTTIWQDYAEVFQFCVWKEELI